MHCVNVPELLFLNIFIYLFFRERGREKERQGEKHRGEKYRSVAFLHVLLPGTERATQACALIGDQTGNPSFAVCCPTN